MYYRIILDFPLMPKPRGKLAPNGHIYHNDKAYTDHTKRVIQKAQSILIAREYEVISGSFCVGFFNGYTQKRGSQSDLDNLIGGLLDPLKKAGVIIDDNRKYWDGSYMKASEFSQDFNVLIICSNFRESEMINEIGNLYRGAKKRL